MDVRYSSDDSLRWLSRRAGRKSSVIFLEGREFGAVETEAESEKCVSSC